MILKPDVDWFRLAVLFFLVVMIAGFKPQNAFALGAGVLALVLILMTI